MELPFGHIKANLKTTGFMLRGQNGAQAEASLLATCFEADDDHFGNNGADREAQSTADTSLKQFAKSAIRS